VSLDSAGLEMSESEAGWRILVGKEFQRIPEKRHSRTEVSSLIGGRRRVMTESEQVERLDCMYIAQVCLL